MIYCKTGNGLVKVYLPNPGRLWELLLPGRTVYLVKKEGHSSGNLTHMAVAVEREGIPVLLHTHLANSVAARLLAERKIPGLQDAVVTRAEVAVGHSRFDFLLEKEGKPFFLEVKSCTLFGRHIAMFPDAVTLRGKRHMEELAAMSRGGTVCGILFLVHWHQVRFFLPDYHTDLEFSRTFKEVKDDLFIRAVSLSWRSDLSLSAAVREITIPWDTIEKEARDSGCYFIILHIPHDVTVTVGSLGSVHFSKGYYLYVGTAKRALTKRIERHMRKKKTATWHIDYLREYADACKAVPIRSSTPLEHELAEGMRRIADGSVPSFGSSDCNCVSHLFRFKENPLRSQTFIDLLLYYRIDRLEDAILSSS